SQSPVPRLRAVQRTLNVSQGRWHDLNGRAAEVQRRLNEGLAGDDALRIPPTALAKALADPHRSRMLELLSGDPKRVWSVRQLAEALEVPRTRLYHHVKVLLEQGLIEVGEQRTVRGG